MPRHFNYVFLPTDSIRNGPYGTAVLANPHILQDYKDGAMLVLGLIDGGRTSENDHAVIHVIDTVNKTVSTMCINSDNANPGFNLGGISSCEALGCDKCWFEVGKLRTPYVSYT